MASTLMPHFPILKPHFQTRTARITLRSAVLLRATARMESSSAAANATVDSATTTAQDTVVQYVVLRRDLIDTWPLGSVVTQGCHASVAAIWTHKDDPDTLSYCSPPNLDSMHKVTLELKGETQLLNLSEKLKAGGIAHKLWIEQPENFATCLATKPYPKSTISSFFKKLKLYDQLVLLTEKVTKIKAHTSTSFSESEVWLLMLLQGYDSLKRSSERSHLVSPLLACHLLNHVVGERNVLLPVRQSRRCILVFHNFSRLAFRFCIHCFFFFCFSFVSRLVFIGITCNTLIRISAIFFHFLWLAAAYFLGLLWNRRRFNTLL